MQTVKSSLKPVENMPQKHNLCFSSFPILIKYPWRFQKDPQKAALFLQYLEAAGSHDDSHLGKK